MTNPYPKPRWDLENDVLRLEQMIILYEQEIAELTTEKEELKKEERSFKLFNLLLEDGKYRFWQKSKNSNDKKSRSFGGNTGCPVENPPLFCPVENPPLFRICLTVYTLYSPYTGVVTTFSDFQFLVIFR